MHPRRAAERLAPELPAVAATVWQVAANGSRSPLITLPLATADLPAAPANRMSEQVAVPVRVAVIAALEGHQHRPRYQADPPKPILSALTNECAHAA